MGIDPMHRSCRLPRSGSTQVGRGFEVVDYREKCGKMLGVDIGLPNLLVLMRATIFIV